VSRRKPSGDKNADVKISLLCKVHGEAAVKII